MIHKIRNDGFEFWTNELDKFHRVDGGPAMIDVFGTEVWHNNGYCHRINNPYYIRINGYEEWYEYGKFIK